MKDSINDEMVFTDLEGKLRALVGSRIQVEVTRVDHDLHFLSGGILQHERGGQIELKLEDVVKRDGIYGVVIVGRTDTHYWVIGTHIPHGYIFRIEDNVGMVIYEDPGPYSLLGRAYGITCVNIQDHRKEKEIPEEAEDPKNPFLGVFAKRDVGVPPEAFFEPEKRPSNAQLLSNNRYIGLKNASWWFFTLPESIGGYFVSLFRSR